MIKNYFSDIVNILQKKEGPIIQKIEHYFSIVNTIFDLNSNSNNFDLLLWKIFYKSYPII